MLASRAGKNLCRGTHPRGGCRPDGWLHALETRPLRYQVA